MNKYLLISLLLFTSCTDNEKVHREYQQGNINAEELLLHGFNSQNSQYISSQLIEKALRGDESAKEIIYAQIDSLQGIHGREHRIHTTTVPVIIKSGR